MKGIFILSILIVIIAIILSTEYKHLAKTIFQLLWYHGTSHQDNKIFPSVYMDGNPKIPKIKRNLIKYDKSKYDFKNYSIESILVLHKNEIIIEEYFNNHNSKSKFNLFSATKTIISMGIGILQDRKLLSINDKIKKYLPYLPLKDETTIKNILEMSSGYSIPKIPFMIDMGFDYFAYNLTDRLINYKVSYKPGEYFIYKNLNTQILGLLIEKVSGQKLNEFINDNIYKYIGRTKAEWNTDRIGNIKAFCCLYLNTEDYLRFAKLILDKGKVGNKVIISENYLKKMFTPNRDLIEYKKKGGEKNYFYGLQAWTLNTDDGHTIKYFWGIQGQYNIIIEDLDMVISIFSDYRKYSHRKDFEIIIKNIIEDARKIVFNM